MKVVARIILVIYDKKEMLSPNIQSMIPLLGPAAVGLNFLEINEVLNFIAFKPDNEIAGVC